MSRRRAVGAVALAFVLLAPFTGVVPGWTTSIAALSAFTAVALVGLNLIFGMTGMLALGQAAFVGTAGYIAGISAQAGLPHLAAAALAVMATVTLARFLAEVFIRLPGIYLAFGTLGLAFVVEGLARAFPAMTGGASGLVFLGAFELSATAWYLVALAALAAALVSYHLLVRSAYGRKLNVVRSDELAAQVLGIDVARTKADVFALGAIYAAVAGVLLVHSVGVLVPEAGGVNQSLELIAMLMIGGSGSLLGPWLGSALVHWLATVAGQVSGVAGLELFIYGAGFFLTVLFAPRGLAGLMGRFDPAPRAALAVPIARPHARTSPATVRDRSPCLIVERVSKQFGGVKAVREAALTVARGEVVTLIGPNGAGKTTLFNLVSGVDVADSGRILLDGTDITRRPIHERAKLIGRSFQVARLVEDMTVLENVLIRAEQLHPKMSEADRLAVASNQLTRFGLSDLSGSLVSGLSAGKHKLIDVARSCLGEPSLLLLDEPAVGLTAGELGELAAMINSIRPTTAVLIVEHNISLVERVADRAVALDRGVVIATGSVAEVTGHPAVKQAYFGALA
jgi:ABC-type branched-subunit amino acid transport system ATPase component/ABC-type branched-subunit amino acid transport system permease subunit